MITLCSLNYHTADYILFQDKIARELAFYKDYKRLIVESSDEQRKLQKISDIKFLDGKFLNEFEGSTAHGKAIQLLMDSVKTKYAIFLDPDICILRKDWDKILIDELENGNDWIGVTYNPLHNKRRMQNIPTVFFLVVNVEKMRKLNLNWMTLHQNIRKKIYRFQNIMWRKVLKKQGYPKWFDFEMGYKALKKVKESKLQISSFKMVQPWDENSILKFDISKLPLDRMKVDPLIHSYPEEWHYKGDLFLTHQRRSYAKSFNETEYSSDWITIIYRYLFDKYPDTYSTKNE